MKKWILPWVVAVSTSLPYREGQITTYPSVYGHAIQNLACPSKKANCLWVQDFVNAMNDAHKNHENKDCYCFGPDYLCPEECKKNGH